MSKLWTKENDMILYALVDKHGNTQWAKIAKEIDGADRHQCAQRWRQSLNPLVKRGSWDPIEDKKLREAVKSWLDKHPEAQNNITHDGWKEISLQIPKRTLKQVRSHWSIKLNPTINRKKWTLDEEKLLKNKIAIIGCSWSKLRAYFPNRIDIDIMRKAILLGLIPPNKEIPGNTAMNDEDYQIRYTIAVDLGLIPPKKETSLKTTSETGNKIAIEMVGNKRKRTMDELILTSPILLDGWRKFTNDELELLDELLNERENTHPPAKKLDV